VNVGRKLVWLRQRRDQKAAGVAEGARTSWDEWLRDLLARDPSLDPSGNAS
jgi:hypothetical protein